MAWLFPMESVWLTSHSGAYAPFRLYARHYSAFKNGRKPRAPSNRLQFVGPGEHLVLITPEADAVFAWRKGINGDGQQGVMCSIFRNESDRRSSDLILAAEQMAWKKWPADRLFTYVDPRKVRSVNPGCCFKKAGWKTCGRSKKGLLILEKFPT